jgi:hypothetical protein
MAYFNGDYFTTFATVDSNFWFIFSIDKNRKKIAATGCLVYQVLESGVKRNIREVKYT